VCVGVIHENCLAEARADGRITFDMMLVNTLRNNCTKMARYIDRNFGGDNGTSSAGQQRNIECRPTTEHPVKVNNGGSSAGQQRLNFITNLGP